MRFFGSVGLSALAPQQRQQLIAEARKHLPDPKIYDGHDYTKSFHFGDDLIIMNKLKNGDVEMYLVTDSAVDLQPL